MNKISPKISIIVPVYNVEAYVAKCLDSIINQTYDNLEIIVVNDGSTDNGGKICDEYAKKDDRIIFINQKNQGLSMARNNGIDIASGEYIGFVDSDDWIAPDMFETLYNNSAEHDADISMCNFYQVYDLNSYSPFSNENTGIKVLKNIHKVTHNIRLSNNFVWNKLYRRYLFNNIRFPKDKIYEDIFVMYKLIDNANKMVISSQCKYYYMRRYDSISLSKFTLSQLDNVEAYIERHEYISNNYPSLEKTCRKQIYLSLLWVLRKACLNENIDEYIVKIDDFIDKVRNYDFSNCGLSVSQEALLTLLFEDINLYIKEINKEYVNNGKHN